MRAVMDWVIPRIQHPGPFEYMATELRDVFGNTSNNALSRWLMANVLQQTGFYQVGSHSYSYFFNAGGVEKILRLLAEFEKRNKPQE